MLINDKATYGPLIRHCTFDVVKSITWASGRVLGPGKLGLFWGPKLHSPDISDGPKKPRFPGPNPLPLALVINLINYRSINS
jgi:hypothetical protein